MSASMLAGASAISLPPLPFPPLFPPSLPIVHAAVPGFGPTTGGNVVLLIGANFSGATSVTFGGAPATILSQDPIGLTIVVLAPAHAAGSVPVIVTTGVGSSSPANYTYIGVPTPPTAASITPVSGPTSGGTAFTITGTNLSGATVLFGALPALGVTVNPAGTSLSGTTPPGLAGNTPVTVITTSGTTTVPGGFTYTAPAPVALTITPATGPVVGGTLFVLAGSNLGGATVTVGGAPATSVTVDPTGSILAGTTPAGTAGNQPVVVTTASGSATVPGGFTYA